MNLIRQILERIGDKAGSYIMKHQLLAPGKVYQQPGDLDPNDPSNFVDVEVKALENPTIQEIKELVIPNIPRANPGDVWFMFLDNGTFYVWPGGYGGEGKLVKLIPYVGKYPYVILAKKGNISTARLHFMEPDPDDLIEIPPSCYDENGKFVGCGSEWRTSMINRIRDSKLAQMVGSITMDTIDGKVKVK